MIVHRKDITYDDQDAEEIIEKNTVKIIPRQNSIEEKSEYNSLCWTLKKWNKRKGGQFLFKDDV